MDNRDSKWEVGRENYEVGRRVLEKSRRLGE
jgi:hypothetical protein